MKVEKFFFGNGVEVLTDNELKATRGGYGYRECCECDYQVESEDPVSRGTFCGNYGDLNCDNGRKKGEESFYYVGNCN